MNATDRARPTFAADALAGRVVCITGAARGLGRAAAEACLDAGAHVVLTDLAADAVAATAAELGPRATGLAHDVAEPGSWDDVIAAVRADHGHLDALVNNAGIHQPRTFAESTVAEFRRSLDVNLTGTFLGIQAFLALRRGASPGASTASAAPGSGTDAGSGAEAGSDPAPGGGSIVNLSSVRGMVSGAGLASYSASKFGVRSLTKAAAVELGPLGIRVNAICPGTIHSEMSAAAAADVDWDLYLDQIPLGVAGPARSIGDAVCWLVSDASAYVSGIELPVDGGVLATGNTPRPRRPA